MRADTDPPHIKFFPRLGAGPRWHTPAGVYNDERYFNRDRNLLKKGTTIRDQDREIVALHNQTGPRAWRENDKMKLPLTAKKRKMYEKIIEDATTDCYGDYEQVSGWACLLDDCIRTPCTCIIGKERAVLEKIDTDDNGSVAIGVVRLNTTRIRILLQDVILEDSREMRYIDAYSYWCKNG